jgi:hypothetical protein
VAAAPTSSISPPRPRAPPSKDPLTRGKAGSLGKWGRLITSGGAEGGRSGRGRRGFGAGPRGFAVGVGGGGGRIQGRRWCEESAW